MKERLKITRKIRKELDKLSYTQDAKEARVVNMPNYYIIPKVDLQDYILTKVMEQQ